MASFMHDNKKIFIITFSCELFASVGKKYKEEEHVTQNTKKK
jgi:hypothetical protein